MIGDSELRKVSVETTSVLSWVLSWVIWKIFVTVGPDLEFRNDYMRNMRSVHVIYALNMKEAASLGKHFVAYILHKIFFSVV